MEYIAGFRMRTLWDVQEIVLSDKSSIEAVSESLNVKKVELGGKRYVVCLNEKDAISLDKRKIAAEQQYDGINVLLTNTDLSPKETALA